MQATVILEYKDKKTAQAVAEAISADNLRTPIGLRVKTTLDNNKVVTEIEWGGKLATFTATIDDLLCSASTAEKTIKIITKK